MPLSFLKKEGEKGKAVYNGKWENQQNSMILFNSPHLKGNTNINCDTLHPQAKNKKYPEKSLTFGLRKGHPTVWTCVLCFTKAASHPDFYFLSTALPCLLLIIWKERGKGRSTQLSHIRQVPTPQSLRRRQETVLWGNTCLYDQQNTEPRKKAMSGRKHESLFCLD